MGRFLGFNQVPENQYDILVGLHELALFATAMFDTLFETKITKSTEP